MIDLHTHSTYSDGSDAPARVVELAAQYGCSALALTDHDGLDGLEEASARANEVGIELIRGCEVSCSFEPGSLHLLCYFVPAHGALAGRLAELRSDRERRNALMLERLASLGFAITLEEVANEAEHGVIGRPHFAAVLLAHRYVSSIAEAFDRYLGKGRPAYIERERVELEDVAATASADGAACVVAHPLSLELDPPRLEREVARFAELGVHGLECVYSEYDEAVRTDLSEIARRHHLVPTGGSDYHGRYKPGLQPGIGRGDLAVPDEALEELRQRC